MTWIILESEFHTKNTERDFSETAIKIWYKRRCADGQRKVIKENHNGKSDKYFVKLKLHRDTTSSTSDLYEFKISLFDNGEPKEFF